MLAVSDMVKWAGTPVRKARKYWSGVIAQGGVKCCRCGKPVLVNDSWQVDHYPISREHGGTQTWPAHSFCNMSAGGKRGRSIQMARKKEVQAIMGDANRNIREI